MFVSRCLGKCLLCICTKEGERKIHKQNMKFSISLFVGIRDGFWPIISCQRCLTAYVTESFIQTDSFEGGMVWD